MSELPEHATELELALMSLTNEGTARAKANQLAAFVPLVDRERGIAVIRLDPELASWLRVAAGMLKRSGAGASPQYHVHRAARIIGGEQSDE